MSNNQKYLKNFLKIEDLIFKTRHYYKIILMMKKKWN